MVIVPFISPPNGLPQGQKGGWAKPIGCAISNAYNKKKKYVTLRRFLGILLVKSPESIASAIRSDMEGRTISSRDIESGKRSRLL